MRWVRFVYVLAVVVLSACRQDADDSSSLSPPAPVTIRSIQTLLREPLGALAQHDAAGPLSIRIAYVSADLSEGAFTPWQGADSSILVLGLAPGRTYTMRVQSLFDGKPFDGPVSEYHTPPLPAALAQVSIQLAGRFSDGYSMAPIGGADDHGYLIIFDSLGTIRWYRDFGPQVFATTQQEDGHFTAFVGTSDGFNMSAGAYVEVTSTGDSVRAVTAVGSAEPVNSTSGLSKKWNGNVRPRRLLCLVSVVVLVIPVFAVQTIVPIAFEVDIVQNRTEQRSVDGFQLFDRVCQAALLSDPRPRYQHHTIRDSSENSRIGNNVQRW